MDTLIQIPPIKISLIKDKVIPIYPGENVTILLNLRGAARVTLNSLPITLSSNDILAVNPRDLCTVRCPDALILAVTIDRSLLNLDAKYKSAYFDCNSAKSANKDSFAPLRTSIIKTVKLKDSLTQSKAYSVAYEIFDELVENFSSAAALAKIKSSKINEIVDFIEKNYGDNLLLNDIADRFHMSVPYLSKLFKESVGKTFADFYDELRINHSMYDLTETNENIVDIAYKHGFPNNHAYIRAFKKVMHALPNETRKQHGAMRIQTIQDDKELNGIIDSLGIEQLSPCDGDEFFINVDYTAESKLVLDSNPSSEILGIGPATDVLLKDIQSIIKDVQNTFPFRYAYIRGIFSDALSFCSRDINGRLQFKYTMIDEVLDFLLSVKLRPVLSFTYMPKALTRDKSVVFQDGYYICEPAHYDEWHQLISNFLHHVISRYGIAEISKWIYLPWVQLDSNNKHLGFTDELSFFLFYKTSYTAVKEISEDLIVSSPEIYPSLNMGYLKNYLQWSKYNNCFPDLLSIKFFPNINWKVIEVKDNPDMAYREIIDNEISSDASLMNRLLNNLQNFLNDHGYKLDIYVMAFNYTITDFHPVLDTQFSANYYLKNYNENLHLLKSLCYWKLSDGDSADHAPSLFFGSTGMYLKNGIPKGTAQALRYLSYIQSYITDRGDGYILSTCGEQANYYRLLLYNYEHPATVNDETLTDPNFDPYSLFEKRKKRIVHFKIHNLPYSHATVKMFIMDSEHGCPYAKWISMGKPHLDYYSDNASVIFDILEASSVPDLKIFDVPVINGVLSLNFNLELFDIETVEIILD